MKPEINYKVEMQEGDSAWEVIASNLSLPGAKAMKARQEKFAANAELPYKYRIIKATTTMEVVE